MELDVRTRIRKSLEEVQKENEARRYEYFKKQALELIDIYHSCSGNFSNEKKQSLIEFVGNYINPIILKELKEDNVFDEFK